MLFYLKNQLTIMRRQSDMKKKKHMCNFLFNKIYPKIKKTWLLKRRARLVLLYDHMPFYENQVIPSSIFQKTNTYDFFFKIIMWSLSNFQFWQFINDYKIKIHDSRILKIQSILTRNIFESMTKYL